MHKNKKYLVWVLICTFVFSFLPISSVKAADDINIISTTTITAANAKTWAKGKGATETFINLADLFWKYGAQRGGVNPSVAYVQSALETGFGNFGGVINESYYNTCGLKTNAGGSDTDADAHKRFASWDEGVQAQLDHLALYAGATGYPRSNTFDPRHFASIEGKAPTVLKLSNNWAAGNYGTKIMNLYNDLATSSKSVTVIKEEVEIIPNNLSPMQCIDTPINNATVRGSTLTVKGWALNNSGVKSVEIFIDSVSKGKATIGESRPDVANFYPAYPNATNSGYSANIDISNIAAGQRTLKIVQTGNDNSSQTTQLNITIDKLVPLGSIDNPSIEQSVSGNTLRVRGWALNPSGVEKIEVYVDNKLKATVNTGLSRPDVNVVYPQYGKATTSGFSTDVNIADIEAGNRVVKVVQTGKDKTVFTDQITFNVKKLKAMTEIDSPTNGIKVTSNTLIVKGWALSASEIKSVKVYVDDKFMSNATIGLSRPDVKTVYPAYSKATTSGYSVNINLKDIANGNRVIKVEQTDANGIVNTLTNKIILDKPTPKICIDTPTNSKAVSGDTLNISGWALNSSGVDKVNIYIDGILKNTTNVGVLRQDVKTVFPQYGDANSGFNVNLDIKDIKAGARTIKVEQIGKDNSKTSSEVKINRSIANLSPISYIDSPTVEYVEKTNSLVVRGWALNGSKVKNINIYVDNKVLKIINPNEVRKDVSAVYSGYPNGDNSGFNTSIDISSLAAGSHRLKVQAVGYDGTSTSTESVFYYKSKTKLIVVDPGHNYGGDYGAVSNINGVKYDETVMNMAVALRLESTLKAQGYSVVLTRSALDRSTFDLSTSLKNRAIIANSLNADLFISVHHNASPSSSARGSEVYYTQNTKPDDSSVVQNADKISRGKDLAIAAASSMSARTGFINKGGKGDVSSLGYSLSVLRNTKMPAILVECGFLTNSTEASMLNNPVIQQQTVDGITSAVKARF